MLALLPYVSLTCTSRERSLGKEQRLFSVTQWSLFPTSFERTEAEQYVADSHKLIHQSQAGSAKK